MSQSLNNNSNSFNTNNSFNTTYINPTVPDKRPNILTWLSQLDPKLRHQDIRDRRVGNIGEWVLQTEEFRTWYTGSGEGESDNSFLFCYGDPGAGKTYIRYNNTNEPLRMEENGQVLTSHGVSSVVIDNLCSQAREQSATVACFYFDFATRNEQSPTTMLGCLLKQLVFGLNEIPEEILEAYEERKNAIGGQGPQISNILKMLKTTSSRRRAFICIDALDECAAEHRAKLLHSLGQLLQQSPGTRIFVTGRPHILPEIGRNLSTGVASLPISPKRDDIVTYLRSRLAADTTPDAGDSNLEADILEKIPRDISEMYVEQQNSESYLKLSTNRHIHRFLLVSLNTDAILQETTVHRRRQKLSAITDGLGLESAYGESLDRIKRQGGARVRLGIAALMWISHSERPLNVVELCHALAVEIGAPNINSDDAPSIGTVLSCCQGLVIVDKEVSTVRLIHFTLQEYLRAHPELFGKAHSTMAETCLSYLNSQQVRALSTSPSHDLQDTPFLEYSSVCWGAHARRDFSDRAKRLALKLFGDYNSHISTRTLLKTLKFEGLSYNIDFDKPLFLSSLHCASFFGIVEIVTDLIEVEGCDTNQRDCVDNTPLVWAALNGHEPVVEMLLKRGNIDPDKAGWCNQTPLFCAAGNGHTRVVKMLLERDEVNPNKPNDYGRVPLWKAACGGHEGVVKVLLERDKVNLNKPVNDKPINDCQTSLWCAARNGHEGVVKMLLQRSEVDPDEPDKEGRTPLWRAAGKGHKRVVKMLLERSEVNPNRVDNEGWTPLWAAVDSGHAEVVKMFLERDDVNPKPDNEGRIPLVYAAGCGYAGVVKVLLELDEVHPDKPTNIAQTALFCAAINGHVGVMKLLLEQEDVHPDKQTPNTGLTPLSLAALFGHPNVAKFLLGRSEVNPDKPNADGVTALLCAAKNGNAEVVKILLEQDDVSPDKPSNDGRAPLSSAAWNGHAEVVKMLLQRDEVNPDKPDNDGWTPLWGAARNGHAEVVKMLLERSEVNPDKPDNGGQTPLWFAAHNGHAEVVKMLLERSEVNPGKPDEYGETLLQLATRQGHTAVVALLRARS